MPLGVGVSEHIVLPSVAVKILDIEVPFPFAGTAPCPGDEKLPPVVPFVDGKT